MPFVTTQSNLHKNVFKRIPELHLQNQEGQQALRTLPVSIAAIWEKQPKNLIKFANTIWYLLEVIILKYFTIHAVALNK